MDPRIRDIDTLIAYLKDIRETEGNIPLFYAITTSKHDPAVVAIYPEKGRYANKDQKVLIVEQR